MELEHGKELINALNELAVLDSRDSSDSEGVEDTGLNLELSPEPATKLENIYQKVV